MKRYCALQADGINLESLAERVAELFEKQSSELRFEPASGWRTEAVSIKFTLSPFTVNECYSVLPTIFYHFDCPTPYHHISIRIFIILCQRWESRFLYHFGTNIDNHDD